MTKLRWPLMLGPLLWMSTALAQATVDYVQPQAATVAQQLALTGSVTTAQDATLSTQVAGLVATVPVDAGDVVEPGQILLTLDSTLAQLALRSDAAALRQAGATLKEAQRLRDEAEPLARQGSLPQSEYATRRAEADIAAAAWARLKAAHEEQAERVARHTLTAPFAGVIRARHAAQGEWLNTGAAVLELVATDMLRIDVQVPQQRFSDMLETQLAQVSIDALPGREFDARVAALVPALDAQTRSFLVRVTIDSADAPIAPGMSARVRFALPGTTDAVAVPRDALLRFPDGSNIVWLIDEDNKARRQPVTLGPMRGERVIVTKGLVISDRVVVRGNETLRPGQAVTPRLYSPS